MTYENEKLSALLGDPWIAPVTAFPFSLLFPPRRRSASL